MKHSDPWDETAFTSFTTLVVILQRVQVVARSHEGELLAERLPGRYYRQSEAVSLTGEERKNLR